MSERGRGEGIGGLVQVRDIERDKLPVGIRVIKV